MHWWLAQRPRSFCCLADHIGAESYPLLALLSALLPPLACSPGTSSIHLTPPGPRPQGFRTKEEVQRFSDVMDEMAYIVATKHSGSLKGEHSTGRNMAPYVEVEWGSKAYELMWELKELFDPQHVLNPGKALLENPLVAPCFVDCLAHSVLS